MCFLCSLQNDERSSVATMAERINKNKSAQWDIGAPEVQTPGTKALGNEPPWSKESIKLQIERGYDPNPPPRLWDIQKRMSNFIIRPARWDIGPGICRRNVLV